MGQFGAGFTLLEAGTRDALRRPSTWVSTACLGVFLGVIPHLGNPAAGVRDNAALAVELTIATWMTFVPFAAGALAVRGVDRQAGHGLPPEVLTLPLTDATAVLARWGVAVLVAGGVGAMALVLAALGWWGAAHPVVSPSPVPWVGLGVGAALGTALAAAIGLVYGACVTRPLALVLLALHLLVARALPVAGSDALWGTLVPDPLRLDVARELAFGRAVGPAWIAWGGATLGLQVGALCAIATWRIARKAPKRIRKPL